MGRQSKKLQMQGLRILRNEVYLQYAAMTKDEVSRSSWTSYEAVNVLEDTLLNLQYPF
jgi:hypothetical protein